ncbi:MAG TPA: hypothetical protein VM163_00975 [bacterium]|nr:hypothetical protein [bacterium]
MRYVRNELLHVVETTPIPELLRLLDDQRNLPDSKSKYTKRETTLLWRHIRQILDSKFEEPDDMPASYSFTGYEPVEMLEDLYRDRALTQCDRYFRWDAIRAMLNARLVPPTHNDPLLFSLELIQTSISSYRLRPLLEHESSRILLKAIRKRLPPSIRRSEKSLYIFWNEYIKIPNPFDRNRRPSLRVYELGRNSFRQVLKSFNEDHIEPRTEDAKWITSDGRIDDPYYPIKLYTAHYMCEGEFLPPTKLDQIGNRDYIEVNLIDALLNFMRFPPRGTPRRLAWRKCEECGHLFWEIRASDRFCSDDCRYAWHNDRRKAKSQQEDEHHA